jgi:EpsI family protein
LVYVGNVARIVAIVFAAQAGGPKWGDVAHEVMGYGVFVIVLGGVLGAASLLRRWLPEAAAPRAADGHAHVAAKPGRIGTAAPTWVAGLVLTLVVGEMLFLRHVSNLPARGGAGVALAADGVNPVELPAFLGTEWIGRRAEVTAVEREILPPDTGYSRKDYVAVADPRRRVFLSVVLSGRDRTSIHRPELCLVAQGWTIAGTETGRLGAAAGSGVPEVPATVLRVRREVQTPRGKAVVPQLVAYWFVGGDRVVASHGQRLAWDAWNRVTQGRADRWAYVLMQTDATDGEGAALARLQAVLQETLPTLAPQVLAPRQP